MGDIEVGQLNSDSASYCAEYTVKKMTKFDDIRLEGRHPEFARMSRQNGGIGRPGCWDVASVLMESGVDELLVDVPMALDFAKRHALLGRYLRRELRSMIGREKEAPEEALDAVKKELQPVQEAAFNASRSFKEAVVEHNAGRVANIEGKYGARYKGKSI